MVTGTRLILILGDQLSLNISSLEGARKTKDIILMGELRSEAAYVRHHKKKIAFIFAAMRHFADELRAVNYRVDYQQYDDEDPAQNFTDLVRRAVERHAPEEIVVTEGGEHRVQNEIRSWSKRFNTPVDIREDARFICSHDAFRDWARGRDNLRMEYFYREMRRKTGLLMNGDKPEGGKWNFDKENRKPAKAGLSMPGIATFKPDEITARVIDLVDSAFADNFGDIRPFRYAVTRKDAETALDHFIERSLPFFGDYQDAMLEREKHLYHSVLSLYINIGLLDGLEVCRRADEAYHAGSAPLNAAEGFIRQIIGWREYMRGVYWLEGESYIKKNFFGHERPLPDFYWTGNTDMNCIRSVVRQTREDAYAHHIQRLMVTGAFAMLAGIDPFAVHEWYLEVYADAYEWVEAPNVIGMSQYADGGLLASKPYAASGAYINRMSDYCKNCRYAVTKKTEEDACPFNALYWDFLARHEDKLGGHPRLAHPYRNWSRMDANKKRAYRRRAAALLSRLDKAGAAAL